MPSIQLGHETVTQIVVDSLLDSIATNQEIIGRLDATEAAGSVLKAYELQDRIDCREWTTAIQKVLHYYGGPRA